MQSENMKLRFSPKPVSLCRGHLTSPDTLRCTRLDLFSFFTHTHLHAFSPDTCILSWNFHFSPNIINTFLCQDLYFPFKKLVCNIPLHYFELLSFFITVLQNTQTNTFIRIFLVNMPVA